MQGLKVKVASLNRIHHSIGSQWSCLTSSFKDSEATILLVQDNRVGNLPSMKERFAKYAIISENTPLQRKKREVDSLS